TTGASATPTSPNAAATPSLAVGEDRRLSSLGGDVVARCEAAGAYLAYWSPAQGFRTDDVKRGPAPVATLTFEGPNIEVTLKVPCAGGVPQLEVVSDHHDN